MYFRLRNHCKLVIGAKRGAIYDLESGKVLSVNQGAVKFLTECQNNVFEDIIDIEDTANQAFAKFVNQLIEKNLGAIYVLEPEQQPTVEIPSAPPVLNFLWLEITSGCNNTCLHCYATSGPCVHKDVVPHERWLAVISEARNVGANAIQLIGGEPLLYPKWRELVLKARAEGYECIEIFTNATLITDADIDFLKTNNVTIATTIYADNAEIHDKVTLNPGSFNLTMASIKKIVANNIPLRVASIIMKTNENEVENIMKLCTELGVQATYPDVVRPTGRGSDKELVPETYTKPPIKPPFYTDFQSFTHAQWFHSCLAGKIAVTSTGDVIPCIFAREQICGNILEDTLANILPGERLSQCWYTTKDKIEKCKACEYRYACGDCRPHAQSSDPAGNWLACPCGCSYDPYTGKWAEEIIPTASKKAE